MSRFLPGLADAPLAFFIERQLNDISCPRLTPWSGLHSCVIETGASLQISDRFFRVQARVKWQYQYGIVPIAVNPNAFIRVHPSSNPQCPLPNRFRASKNTLEDHVDSFYNSPWYSAKRWYRASPSIYVCTSLYMAARRILQNQAHLSAINCPRRCSN